MEGKKGGREAGLCLNDPGREDPLAANASHTQPLPGASSLKGDGATQNIKQLTLGFLAGFRDGKLRDHHPVPVSYSTPLLLAGGSSMHLTPIST